MSIGSGSSRHNRRGALIGLAFALIAAALLVLAVTSNLANADPPQPSNTPLPPAFWTPLPQPASERSGVWTACTDGVRLFLAEGTPAAGPSITSQPDPRCGS